MQNIKQCWFAVIVVFVGFGTNTGTLLRLIPGVEEIPIGIEMRIVWVLLCNIQRFSSDGL